MKHRKLSIILLCLFITVMSGYAGLFDTSMQELCYKQDLSDAQLLQALNDRITHMEDWIRRNGEKERIKLRNEINGRINEYFNPFTFAVDRQSTALVKRMIAYGAEVNYTNDKRETPLFMALGTDNPNLEIIKALVEAGANCDYEWNSSSAVKQGFTPLIKAIESKNSRIIKAVLSGAKNFDSLYSSEDEDDVYKVTPLGYLVSVYSDILKENRDIVVDFIDKGASVDSIIEYNNKTKESAYKTTPMEYIYKYAFKNGDYDLLEKAINSSHEPNASFYHKWTSKNGEIESVRDNLISMMTNNYTNKSYSAYISLIAKDVDINSIRQYAVNGIIKNETTILNSAIFWYNDKDSARYKQDYRALITILLANPSIDVNKCGATDIPPLHLAAKNNNKDIYKELKDKGADVNKTDSDGKKALYYLMQNCKNTTERLFIGYEEKDDKTVSQCVDDIIKNKQVNIPSSDGKIPMMITLDNDDCENAIKLLNAGADPKIADSLKKNTMDYAFLKNKTQMVDALLDKNVPLGSSLFSAIEAYLKGYDCKLESFLAIKKDVSITYSTLDGIKYGPIVWAAHLCSQNGSSVSKCLELIKILARCGYNINETVIGGADNGANALFLAMKNPNTEELAKRLIDDTDIDLNATNKSSDGYTGRTVLFYALENHKKDLVQKILKRMDYTVKDIQVTNMKDHKATLLMFFAKYADFDEINSILEEMVNDNPDVLNRRDDQGWTPFLYAAAYNEDYRVMQVLRMYGSDIDATDYDGNNAVQLAENNSKKDVITSKLARFGVY